MYACGRHALCMQTTFAMHANYTLSVTVCPHWLCSWQLQCSPCLCPCPIPWPLFLCPCPLPYICPSYAIPFWCPCPLQHLPFPVRFSIPHARYCTLVVSAYLMWSMLPPRSRVTPVVESDSQASSWDCSLVSSSGVRGPLSAPSPFNNLHDRTRRHRSA